MESTAVPISMVMTHDDAVEVTFTDGSKVQLSPCGSNLLYNPPRYHSNNVDSSSPNTMGSGGMQQHPLYASSGVHQRTCFVTSSYRSKVTSALEFRNRFASHPYLCAAGITDEKPLELYADITKAEWPASVDQCSFEQQQDHSIHLSSADSLATLVLSPNGHDFSLKYLCKLPAQAEKHSAGEISKLKKETNRFDEASQHEQRRNSEDAGTFNAAAKRELRILDCQGCASASSDKETDKRCISSARISHQRGGNLQSEFVHRHTGGATQQGHTYRGTGYANPREQSRRSASGCGDTCTLSNVDRLGHGRDRSSPVQHKRCKFWYVWVVQNHSVAHCPRYLKEPVGLLLTHHVHIQEGGQSSKQDEGPVEGSSSCHGIYEGQREGERRKGATLSTPLPRSLPLSCEHSHLHKHHWKKGLQETLNTSEEESDTLTTYGRKVKVLFASGVVYRLFWDPCPSVEIYPGDGSVMLSCDDRGSYFRLIKVDGCTGRLCEQMILASTPPPDAPHTKYSIANIIRRGSRLLHCMGVHKRTVVKGEDHCCWKKLQDDEAVASSGSLIEGSVIPGIGRLEAFSCGLVRGHFNDGVIMQLKYDTMPDREGALLDQEKENSGVRICRATLPDGSVRRIDVKNRGAYSRYVTVLLDWGAGVWSGAKQRSFHPDIEVPTYETSRIIEAELHKIQRFTHIAKLESEGKDCINQEHSVTPCTSACRPNTKAPHAIVDEPGFVETQVTSWNPLINRHISRVEIQRALRETAETVCAIDECLHGGL